MVLTIGFAVAAEYIRHFRPGAGHRPALRSVLAVGFGSRNQMRQQVQGAGRRADLARSDAQVLGGGGEAAMTEQQLNGP